MKYSSVFHNETGENTYLVFDENSKNGVIIDPGCEIDKILKLIDDNDVNVKYIFITHCHYDHIMSIVELKNKTNNRIKVNVEKCKKHIVDKKDNVVL